MFIQRRKDSKEILLMIMKLYKIENHLKK